MCTFLSIYIYVCLYVCLLCFMHACLYICLFYFNVFIKVGLYFLAYVCPYLFRAYLTGVDIFFRSFIQLLSVPPVISTHFPRLTDYSQRELLKAHALLVFIFFINILEIDFQIEIVELCGFFLVQIFTTIILCDIHQSKFNEKI